MKCALARLAVAPLALYMAACSSGLRATYVPDGRKGFAVDCAGYLNSWSSCLVRAGRACGSRGYEVIKGSEEDRSMLIACKVPSAAAAPQ
ncbi:MAG: hypothetical protein ACLPV8_21375 [Steroidobacteraceae bacterium]